MDLATGPKTPRKSHFLSDLPEHLPVREGCDGSSVALLRQGEEDLPARRQDQRMTQHEHAFRTGYLTPAQARRVYNQIGRVQDLQALYEHRAIATLIASGDFEHAQSVFELGYGTGALAKRLLTRQLPVDARYTGVDVSPRMYELATRRLHGISHAELQLSDGSLSFPVGDTVFDRFLAAYVLDLLSPDDIGLVLAEAHRLLADSGLLCLTSLSEGATPPARLLTRIWRTLWSLRPALVGGCRPLTITDYLDPTSWSIRHHTRITTLAITSEVVIAAKRTPDVARR